MIEVKKMGIVLSKTNADFEAEGVFNPGVIQESDTIHLLYRAVAKGNYSSMGYCKLSSPMVVAERLEKPLLFPQFDYEKHGIEDPRIVKIDGVYFITYTAYDGVNALGALATSTDLVHFEKHGIISPRITYPEFRRLVAADSVISERYLRYNAGQGLMGSEDQNHFIWDKNVIFFPRRIGGKLHFLHRVKPDIQIVAILELSDLTMIFWQNYFLHLNASIVIAPKYPHEVSYVGGGCPPIETAEGWLLIYHSVYDTLNGYIYTACAALLDLDNPIHERARLPYPLLLPEFVWELVGMVTNVCFPTGTVIYDDTLYIYYGAADERIACASMSLSGLIQELLHNEK